MEHTTTIKKGIGILRVSSTKQGLAGDSPADQKNQINIKARFLNADITKWFTFVQSSSGEIQPSQEAIDYCKAHQGEIAYCFIKSIDRFTRGGSYLYDHLNMQLVKYGVQLLDVEGIIGTETVNTLEHLGMSFSWSKFSPTRKNEILAAEDSKDEVRRILTRMIGAEIRYVRMGYRVRPSPPGYQNTKIDTDHGTRVILTHHLIESPWFIRMFELRIQGNLTDEEIVDQINLMGYKSRKTKRRDAIDKTKVIGYGGEKPLNLKQFQRFIQNPIYAGVNTEKWTSGQPVKGKFEGLVTVDMFNHANRGKISIFEEGDQVTIHKGQLLRWQAIKKRDNPDYPYKFIRCPKCNKPLLGSAPRNKAGNHIARYHCGRTHKYWSINKVIFDRTIKEFCLKLHFKDEFKAKFRQRVLDVWDNRQRSTSEMTISLNQQVASLELQINQLKDQIKSLTSPAVMKMFEDDISGLLQSKVELIQKRDHKEDEQVKIETLINYVLYLMEHLHELLLGGSDKVKNAKMFELVFEENPTYQDLVDGTPKLSPLFKLNDAYNSSQNLSTAYQNCHLISTLYLDLVYQSMIRWGI